MHMATIDIKVPDIGDFAEVAIIEVLVQPGDTIKAEQSLIQIRLNCGKKYRSAARCRRPM